MTNIIFSGKHWIGAGRVYRKPGTYAVSDELAAYLTQTHPELFALGEAAAEAPAPVTDANSPSEAEANPDPIDTHDEGDRALDAGSESVEATEVNEVGDQDKAPSTDEAPNEPEAVQESSEASTPTKPLSRMNKDELQALAAEIGAHVNADEMTADQMRAAIKAQQEAQAA